MFLEELVSKNKSISKILKQTNYIDKHYGENCKYIGNHQPRCGIPILNENNKNKKNNKNNQNDKLQIDIEKHIGASILTNAELKMIEANDSISKGLLFASVTYTH